MTKTLEKNFSKLHYENEKLKKEVKQLEIDLGELDYLRKENKTLKDLLIKKGKK